MGDYDELMDRLPAPTVQQYAGTSTNSPVAPSVNAWEHHGSREPENDDPSSLDTIHTNATLLLKVKYHQHVVCPSTPGMAQNHETPQRSVQIPSEDHTPCRASVEAPTVDVGPSHKSRRSKEPAGKGRALKTSRDAQRDASDLQVSPSRAIPTRRSPRSNAPAQPSTQAASGSRHRGSELKCWQDRSKHYAACMTDQDWDSPPDYEFGDPQATFYYHRPAPFRPFPGLQMLVEASETLSRC